MRKMRTPVVLCTVFALGLLALRGVAAEPGSFEPLTGEPGRPVDAAGNAPPSLDAAPGLMSSLIFGALYGTDGANLYVIDKTTGSTMLLGPHGTVEHAIGALAFDASGVLYGTSVTRDAQLYIIDVGTGAATPVGPLDIGMVFEGGLYIDASGQLFGVNQGSVDQATAFMIDTATGAGTILGPSPGENRDLNGLAYDGETLYAVERVSNTLGTVNLATGAYVPVGDPGVTVGDASGLAVDPADGALYASFSGTGGFYVLDKGTGAATFVGDTKATYGLVFAPSAADYPYAVYLPLAIR